MRLIGIAVLAFFLTGCGMFTEPQKATKILEDNGYTHIQITGYAPFLCGRDDDFATGFKAINSSGHEVSGAVCSGILKGYTIRFNN